MKRNINRIVALVIAALVGILPAQAKHIIGGEITYECLGNDSYRFTMFVYRDCSSDGAAYDDPAPFSIYQTFGTTSSYFDDFTVNLVPNSIEDIPPPSDPCVLTPPSVCVQKARYEFTRTLPAFDGTYTIIYQRCCRNNTISNIVTPEDSGATYAIELNQEAQAACNNSPTYNDFPPTVVCVGSPLFFDHSASDVDGDQLVYEFCAPLLGGGPFGTPENPGDADACDGVTPMPPCGPPFNPVQFVLPTYSEINPMGGDPQVSIDPNTGIITGLPTTQGQFVVGVCVSEYRNGVLLSTVRRDFQFNVTSCEATVDARIDFDEIIDGNEFVINSCGNNTITFGNNSVQEQNIEDFEWRFQIDGETQVFTEWEPTVTFPDFGTYQGVLVLNEDNANCNDSAVINVNVYPEINADFTFSYDTCVAGPITFTDLSVSGEGPDAITDWFWNFDNGQQGTDTLQNPVYMLNSPGIIPVALTVTDINGCTDTELQDITWQPAPPILLIEPSTFDGCLPGTVFFNNLSIPIDSTYDIVWDFGDGSTSGEVSPIHTYTEEGVFDVSLMVTSPIGCFVEDAWEDWIRMRPSPIADFTFAPQEVSSFAPDVTFTDESIDPSFWFWDFDGEGTSNEQNPMYTFPDTGQQVITLVVTHQSGCMDTMIQVLDVVPRVTYFMPNAFTPNMDGLNDYFIGAGVTAGMENFQMTIWNRWGEQVFITSDPNDAWNGRKNNTGKESPSGVYVYIVQYTDPRANSFVLKGYATLVR